MTRRRPVVGCPSDDGLMRIDDFFQESPDTGNPWDSQETELNAELLTQLAQGAAPDPKPLETALSLTRFVREEFEAFGTEPAGLRISEEEARAALRTLRLVLQRQGIEFKRPWLVALIASTPETCTTGAPYPSGDPLDAQGDLLLFLTEPSDDTPWSTLTPFDGVRSAPDDGPLPFDATAVSDE